jgi:hypothetical protein
MAAKSIFENHGDTMGTVWQRIPERDLDFL